MATKPDSVKGRIQALYGAQLQQCRHLDLQTETTPRDSRYSQGLIDMMQRLDNAMREGRNTGDLSRKVDVSLKQETQAFFAKVANSNARKWNQLVQRCEHDVELILREAQDKGLYQPNTTAPPAKKTKYTTHDLDMEELRLEEDYNRNWMRHEGFHLQEAFRSQQNKLDREWDVYTEQLHDAVNEKKKSILGNNYAMHMEKLNLGRSGGNATKDNSDTAERFHHPEKQKSLIHTAPVLSPVLDTGKPRVAAGSAMRAVRNGKEDAVIQSEIHKLDKQLEASLASLEAQKVHASKWMHQQNVRIMVQAEESVVARLPMANHFGLLLKLQRALDAMASSTS